MAFILGVPLILIVFFAYFDYLLNMLQEKSQEALTQREQEIYDLLISGSTPKEIAYTLQIKYDTVITHQRKIYRKLGVHSINDFLLKYHPVKKTLNSENEEYHNATFRLWFGSHDGDSTSNVAITDEEINGKINTCVTVNGNMSKNKGSFALAVGMPDKSTLKVMQSMRCFSFNALGDGNIYYAKLALFNNEGSHFVYAFQTVKNKIINVTVNVPDDLTYQHWEGEYIKFDHNKIISLEIGPTYYTRQFNLKFWDIRLYK